MAVTRAAACGFDCVQLFTSAPGQWPKGKTTSQSGQLGSKNNNQWRAKETTDDDATRFRAALAETGVSHPLVHDSYLINLASPDDVLWNKSIEAFQIELLRAEKLGIPYVVTHPGAFTTSSEAEGIQRVIEALDRVHGKTEGIQAQTLLENTAGQGSCLGWKFEHLAAMIQGVKRPELVGVCIDTCHTLAGGYPLQSAEDYAATIAELDRIVGLAKVKAIHVNDSKQGLGSRVDRHEHIGRGKLGLEAFRHLVNDPRFANTPMYLETAKEQEDGEEMDIVNLRALRNLIATECESQSRP